MPEISVLMGTYNEKKEYVARAVDSVLNQTFADFEFIICDDGSERQFYQWLEKFCMKDTRIRLLRFDQNRGLAAALNQGLSQASGKYIVRMDADDISKKERFRRQHAFLETHLEYTWIGCAAKMFDAGGVWGMRTMQPEPDKKSFLNTSPFIHPTVMIRREAVEKMHGYCEYPYVRRVEDYDFFMRLYAAGYRGFNLSDALYLYREDLDSMKKRKYRFRVNECLVRFLGYRRLGIGKRNLRYVLKPLFTGLIPMRIMKVRHKRMFRL